MLTALILILLVAGIVYAARRWPDVEARFFGADKVDVPAKETAEPRRTAPADKAADSVKEHAKNAGAVADRTVNKVTEFAGGLFKKKSITAEPKLSNEKDEKDDSEIFSSDPVQGDEVDAGAKRSVETEEEVTDDKGKTSLNEDEPVTERPASAVATSRDHTASPLKRAPGERVTSTPARPSQPAYHDGTRTGAGSSESFERLSEEADQAWRDREYEKCEEACLKILVQQPKNIKYMTRIGQVYQQLSQLDDAKEAFEAAKKLDPRNFFVLNRLTEVERLQSDKKGRTQLNKVLKK